jgi:hypothetical protein
LMVVPVPAGSFTLTADWTNTPDVRLGRWISLLALLLVTTLGLALRRRTHPTLK